jgi:NADP-dependent 3-hydroxy acid dehydrogenase YdfG
VCNKIFGRRWPGTTVISAQLKLQVVAVDKSEKISTVFTSHPNLTTKCVDITNFDAIQKLAQEVGNIDALLNCAGYVFVRSRDLLSEAWYTQEIFWKQPTLTLILQLI